MRLFLIETFRHKVLFCIFVYGMQVMKHFVVLCRNWHLFIKEKKGRGMLAPEKASRCRCCWPGGGGGGGVSWL